jgi:hypothetical protein
MCERTTLQLLRMGVAAYHALQCIMVEKNIYYDVHVYNSRSETHAHIHMYTVKLALGAYRAKESESASCDGHHMGNS